MRVAGQPAGMVQCYRHTDRPGWQQAVGIPSAAGIDYLIGEDGQRGRGIGSAAIAALPRSSSACTPRSTRSYRCRSTATVPPAGRWSSHKPMTRI